MSKETKFEDAYVASESYCGCKQGEFLQPVTATHANNVYMQGIVPLTKDDNVIGKNIPNFGKCKLHGKCQLANGQRINWEKVTPDVRIKKSNALNGKSCFKCPYSPSEEINFYDHQQNKLEDGHVTSNGEAKANIVENKSNLEKAGDYLGKSLKQVVLGEFTDDVTIVGTIAEVALGFTGLDFAMDIRDFIACAGKGDWLGMGLSAIGLIPVVGGAVKAVSRGAEGIADGLKSVKKSLKPAQMALDIKDGVKATGKMLKNAGKGLIRNGKNLIEFVAHKGVRELADNILKAGQKIIRKGKSTWGELTKQLCNLKSIFGFVGCFSGETLVKTENGYRKIEDVKRGEKVYSYNILTGEQELKEVLELKRVYERGETVKLRFEKGIELESTLSHNFMTTEGKWKKAEELEIGESFYSEKYGIIKLKEKELLENASPKIMYDLEVEDNHNYLITEEDILVHNGNCPAIAKQVENAIEEAKKLGKKHIKVKLKGYPNSRKVENKLRKKLKKNPKFKGWIEHKGAIFKKAIEEVEVDGIKVEVEYFKVGFGKNAIKDSAIKFNKLTNNYDKHFSEASDMLLKKLKRTKSGELIDKLGKNAKRVNTTIVAENGIVYTWHHDLGKKSLVLVEQSAHKRAKHMGAGSMMKFLGNFFKK